jgi:DNA-binding MarR family transcriptional regulator
MSLPLFLEGFNLRILETFVQGFYAPPVSTDPAGEAWHLITNLFVAHKRQFPNIASQFGLYPGAMNALLFLEPGEPKPMGALAEAWQCDASNVTWLIDRLEEQGLAERVPHATDRRVRTVALTRKGQKLRAQIQARFFEPPEAFRALSAQDAQTLCRILRKIEPNPT